MNGLRRYLRALIAIGFVKPESPLTFSQPQTARVERLTIADEQGDYGLPMPFSFSNGDMGYALMSLVFDTLVWRDKTGALVPALAMTWQEAEDHKSVEFVLNPTAHWHDGKPVTAEDVKFSFDCFRRHPHPLFEVGCIEGVDDLGNGRVRVRLRQVHAPFIPHLVGSLPILPKHVFKYLEDPRCLKKDEIVGSGPYRLTRYDQADGRYLFSANEDYYLGPPRVRSIGFLRMAPSLAILAMKRGELDMILNLPLPLAREAALFATVLENQPGVPMRLRFNHARPPFNERRFRKAIARGINREELLSIVDEGEAEVCAGRFVQGSFWQRGAPLANLSFNLDASRRALGELGFTHDAYDKLLGPGGRVRAVELGATRRTARVAAALAVQLERLGLEVRLRVFSTAILTSRITNEDFDFAVVAQGALGDPESMLSQLVGSGPFSDAFRERDDLTELLKQQMAEPDADKRRAMLDRAQAIYVDELQSFFLYSPNSAIATNGKLRPWFTPGGIAAIPLPVNKLMLVQS